MGLMGHIFHLTTVSDMSYMSYSSYRGRLFQPKNQRKDFEVSKIKKLYAAILSVVFLCCGGALYAAPVPVQSTGAMFEALGIPKDQVREAWITPELKLRAGQWRDTKLRYESGSIGILEVWDRELAALRALMSQPEVAASPLMPELIRAYSKRLKQQLDMLKAEYESGLRGLEPVRNKELEIAEFRKRHGLSETPPPEREKTARVAPPAPSPVGKWVLFAYERTGKSRMPTSLTVFTDGRYESRTPKGATDEIVRGTWRQDGDDVYFTDSGKEFRNRFDGAGRLVPDGQEELHKHGCKLFFERETGK